MKIKSLLNRKNDFWRKFEDSIIEIIYVALQLLDKMETLPKEEDDINRKLYTCLVEANYILQFMNRGRESPPMYESRNQPFYGDIERAGREYKIPDFQWSITDVSETDPKKSSKQFVLECKRLGEPITSWILNENYVNHGVLRFISMKHGYGLGVESSAMLGYVQSMQICDILSEVNTHINRINQLPIIQTEDKEFCVRLSHEIEHEYSRGKLRLEHIWIDLRRFY